MYPFRAGRFGTGASFAVDRETWTALDGVDPLLGAGTPTMGGEDLDLFLRVLLAGRALAVEPRAVVWHWHRRELEQLRRQMYGYGTGLAAYGWKHMTHRRTGPGIARRVPAAVRAIVRDARGAGTTATVDLDLSAVELRGLVAGAPIYIRSRLAQRRGAPPRPAVIGSAARRSPVPFAVMGGMARMLLPAACVAVSGGRRVLPAVAGAAVELPPGFQQRTVFSGLTFPTAVRFAARRPRVFVAEKSRPDPRLRRRRRRRTGRSSPTCGGRSTTTATAGCSGLAVDPQFPARPYLYALYTRDALPGGDVAALGRRERPAVRERGLPRRAAGVRRVHRHRAPREDHGRSGDERRGRPAADPGRRLVLGVPEPLGRRPRTSGPTGSSTRAAATARTSTTSTTARSTTACATTRRTRAGRCARRICAPTGDATGLDGTIIRIDPDTGRGLARQPARGAARTRTRGASSPTACATRSGSPCDPASGDLWIGDVGWGSWEEVNRLPNPAAPGRREEELRLALLRGRRAARKPRAGPSTSTYDLGICERALRRGPGCRDAAGLLVLPRHERDRPEPLRAGARRAARVVRAGLVRDRHGVLHDRRLRRRVRGRAVLRRLHAAVHLVHGHERGRAGPDEGEGLRREAPTSRSTSSAARAATSSTSTSSTATSTGSNEHADRLADGGQDATAPAPLRRPR